MNRLQQQGNLFTLGLRYHGKHITVKVNGTALIPRLGPDFSRRFEETQTFVSNHEPDSFQASPLEPLEQTEPTRFVLLHALRSARHFPITILVHCHRHQDGHVLIRPTPVTTKINAVHIHIRILAPCQGTIAPGLDPIIRLLVQLTERGRRNSAPPKQLRHILDTPRGHAGQIHLHHRLFHAALAAAVTLNDRGLEGKPFQARNRKRQLPRARGQTSVIGPAAIALSRLCALVARRAGQLLGLGIQKTIEGILHRPSNKFTKFRLENRLIQLYKLPTHGLSPPG